MFLFQSQFHTVIGLFIKLIRSPSPVNKLSLLLHFSSTGKYRKYMKKRERDGDGVVRKRLCLMILHRDNCQLRARQNPFIRKLLTSAASMPIMFILITFHIITNQTLISVSHSSLETLTRESLDFQV